MSYPGSEHITVGTAQVVGTGSDVFTIVDP